MEFHHIPVLFDEVMEWMQPRADGVYADGTLGGGGHSEGILHLSGAQISMQTLDLEAGEAKLTGRFDGLEYTAARAAGGFWHRLLR